MKQVFGKVSDYSFTNIFGDRFYSENWEQFQEEKKHNTYLNDELRKPEYGYVSYYTKDGGQHCVGFHADLKRNGYEVLGKFYVNKENIPLLDSQRKFPHHLLFHEVAQIVKDERWDEFLGWSL